MGNALPITVSASWEVFKLAVRYSYLKQQFSDCDDLWEELKNFVGTGEFTLGKPLKEFEDKFAQLIGTKFAIGVGSGTDAIKISLKSRRGPRR